MIDYHLYIQTTKVKKKEHGYEYKIIYPFFKSEELNFNSWAKVFFSSNNVGKIEKINKEPWMF